MKTDFFNSTPWQEAYERVKFRLDALTAREVSTFGGLWYPKHFRFGDTPHIENDFKTILGKTTMPIMASTINSKSAEPLRKIDTYEAYKQGMFTKAHGYRIEGDELRDWYKTVQLMQYQPDGMKKCVEFLTTKLWNVVERSVEGVHAAIDVEILYLLSHKFEYEFTADNDPGSPFIGQKLHYGGNTANCGHVSDYTWTEANLANFDALKEIQEVMDEDSTIEYSTILIDRATLNLIMRSTKMKQYINDYLRQNQPINGVGIINQWMQAHGYPVFEVVERTVRVQTNEKDAKYTPYKAGQLVFLPSNELGTIETCYSDAEIGIKEDGVDYRNYGRVEVVQYQMGERENSSYAEITKARLTECPSISCIKDIRTLDTTTTSD